MANTRVTPDYVASKLQGQPASVLLIDTRPPFYFRQKHIPGSINIYEKEKIDPKNIKFGSDEDKKVFESRGNKEVVVVDDTNDNEITMPDQRVGITLLILKNAGISAKLLEGGFQAFEKAYPQHIKAAPKPVYQKPPPKPEPEPEDEGPDVPGLVAELTPIQIRFFDAKHPEPHWFNQSIVLQASQRLNHKIFENTVRRVVCRHGAWRTRYKNFGTAENPKWVQYVLPPTDFTRSLHGILSHVDLSGVPKSEVWNHVDEECNKAQSTLALEEGPIGRVVVINIDNNQPELIFIVLHHLVVDGVSWRILVENFNRYHKDAVRGKLSGIYSDQYTSWNSWAERLKEYAQSSQLRQEMKHWMKQVEGYAPLPTDFDFDKTKHMYSKDFNYGVMSLSVDETELLIRNVPKVHKTRINDVLLTSLAQAVRDWTKRSEVFIDLEGHGREEVFPADISETVGWFTSLFPVKLVLGMDQKKPNQRAIELQSVKSQLSNIPFHGVGFGILKYLCEDKEVRAKCNSIPPFEISFNYLGQAGFKQGRGGEEEDSMMAPMAAYTPATNFNDDDDNTLMDSLPLEEQLIQKAREKSANSRRDDVEFFPVSAPSGRSASEMTIGEHLIDINGIATPAGLNMTVGYYTAAFKEETIQKFIKDFKTHLLEYCNDT